MDVLLERGYQFVDSKYGMEALTHGKVWGLFDDSHMQPDIDRQHFAEHEPSIAEMTAKAIELLSQDKDGFFLIVEGSQVDWAGHNNDPIYMTTDFLAFDAAVKVACDFADEEGRTLVLAYPDHNTGGMKIGHYYTDVSYTATTIEDLVEPLKGMTMSANGVARDVIYDNVGTEADPTWVINKDSLIASLADNWAIDATEDDINEIIELEPTLGLSYALARVISKNHTVIGWTTHGHNGETVPVWVYGADAPVGTIDNTELAVIAANAMNANLNKATRKFYMDLGSVTNDYTIVDDDGVIVNDGGVIVVDEDGNPVFDGKGNLTLMVGKAELPISKDYMIFKGRTKKLPGLTVYAPATGKVYVSKKALRILHRL
jgi:alkaline phosphatase